MRNSPFVLFCPLFLSSARFGKIAKNPVWGRNGQIARNARFVTHKWTGLRKITFYFA
jgi:hypothetical protein